MLKMAQPVRLVILSLAQGSRHCTQTGSLSGQQQAQVLAGHSGPVRCGCFNLDGSSLITGGGENDMSLRIWSTSTGDCTAVVSGHLFHSAGDSPALLLHHCWLPILYDEAAIQAPSTM